MNEWDLGRITLWKGVNWSMIYILFRSGNVWMDGRRLGGTNRILGKLGVVLHDDCPAQAGRRITFDIIKKGAKA